jgi:hypothetical protein
MGARLLKMVLLAGASLGAAMAASPASAAIASWTNWVSAGVAEVAGNLQVGATTVDVTYRGPYSFAQVADGVGTNYWVPSAPYISSTVENAPPDSDIIALNPGSPPTKTITFSQAVVDPLIALVSWNGNTVDFGTPIQILSFGVGFWGNGTPILNAAGTGFFGSGEVHGVIRLPGTFTQISFTDTSENWHGFTVGVLGVAPPTGVPEPATLALLGLGLVGLFGARRFAAA